MTNVKRKFMTMTKLKKAQKLRRKILDAQHQRNLWESHLNHLNNKLVEVLIK